MKPNRNTILLIACLAGGLIASIPVAGGTLSGSLDKNPPSSVNLTTEGNLDWGHWGLSDSSSLDVKAGAGSLKSYTVYGDPDSGPSRYDDAGIAYSWTDGDPDADATATHTGIYFSSTDASVTNGYTFTVPAGTTARTLRLYFGVYSCRAHVEARLSDNSAPPFVDENLAIHGDASIEAVQTITFAANTENQSLDVTVYVLEDFAFKELGWHGNVTLMSATLNVPAPHFTSQPVSATNWLGQTQQFSVAALGALPLSCQWYVGTPGGSHTALANGGQISGVTNTTLTIGNLALVNATNYYAVVTSPYGSVTSSVASLTLLPITGSLAAAALAAPSAVDITAQGHLDWGAWGLYSETDFDQKAGGANQISNFTQVGDTAAARYDNALAAYSWTDGSPDTTATDSAAGIYFGGVNNGYQITVPADKTARVFTLYAGGWNTTVHVEARLSDQSAPGFVDSSLVTPANASLMAAYTIQYAAASPNQTLTVTVTCGAGGGNVTLMAATLAAPALYIAKQPVSTTNWVGQTQKFSVAALGALPMSYQWYSGTPDGNHVALANGGQFSGATGATLTVANLGLANTNYFAVVASPSGSVTSHVASLTFMPTTGTLTGAALAAPATVDLTVLGKLDWAAWGLNESLDFEQKAGGTNQIGNFTQVSGAAAARYNNALASYSWTDGSINPAITETQTGIYFAGVGNGYQITIPADQTSKVFTLYAGGYNTTVRVEALLSDQSAAPFVDASLVTPGGASLMAAYTIQFTAGSPGQTLTVTVTCGTDGGNVTLMAATLAPALKSTKLGYSYSGSNLVLTWPGNGILLESTNVLGPWTTNTSVSPFSIAPATTRPQTFYRVKQN